VAKTFKRIVGHEQYDDRSRLRTELEAKRGRYGTKVPRRSATNAQCPFTVLPTQPHSRLDDRWEHEKSRGFSDKLAGAMYVPVKSAKGHINIGVDCRSRGRFSPRSPSCSGKHRYHSEK
jgi:hypothetical protein